MDMLPPREQITVKRTPDSASKRYEELREMIAHILNGIELSADAFHQAGESIDTHTKGMGNLLPTQHPMHKASEDWWHAMASLSKLPFQLSEQALRQVSKDHLTLHWEQIDQMGDWALEQDRTHPGDEEVNAQLNYRFFTHNALDAEAPHTEHGSLNAVNADELRAYFPQGEENTWPNMLWTSSHALCRDHNDVSGIMQGFHGLIANSFAREKHGKLTPAVIPLHRVVREPQEHVSDYPLLIIMASVFNDHSAAGNGGKLCKRLPYLRHLSQRINSGDILQPSFEEVVGKGLTAMSPASIRGERALLSLLVENPDAIPVPDRADFENGGYKTPSQLALNLDTPIVLRHDAHHILQHIKLAGYSKGGNIQTDLLRLLLVELQSSLPDGSRRFQMRKPDGSAVQMDDRAIHDLMQNTGLLCVNPGITPLNNWEKKLGLRRITARNPSDTISGFAFEEDAHYHKGENDDIYELKPRKVVDPTGHGFVDALGHYDKRQRGYLNDADNLIFTTPQDKALSEEYQSRQQCFFASFVNKVGLSNIRDVANGGVEIEFSTGGDGKHKEAVAKAIKQELQRERVPVTDIQRVGHTNRLRFDFDHAHTNGKKALAKEKFAKALAKVEQTHPDLVVSLAAYAALGADGQELRRATQR